MIQRIMLTILIYYASKTAVTTVQVLYCYFTLFAGIEFLFIAKSRNTFFSVQNG